MGSTGSSDWSCLVSKITEITSSRLENSLLEHALLKIDVQFSNTSAGLLNFYLNFLSGIKEKQVPPQRRTDMLENSSTLPKMLVENIIKSYIKQPQI